MEEVRIFCGCHYLLSESLGNTTLTVGAEFFGACSVQGCPPFVQMEEEEEEEKKSSCLLPWDAQD
jgi:hypothetical protein